MIVKLNFFFENVSEFTSQTFDNYYFILTRISVEQHVAYVQIAKLLNLYEIMLFYML